MYGVGMTSAQRLRGLAFEQGGVLALAALILYVWIAPHHIVDGDNAELVTTGALGGVPHPSGYPLFMLWLRATSWLPGASPAHTAAIATALLGVATVLVLHAAARAWGVRPLAATFAVAMFAAAPVVLRVSTEAEVFALNNLAVAVVLWLAARHGPLRGAWRVALLGLVAGLGLSDHVTCVLVAPVGILGVLRGVREATLPRAASISIAVGALALGLLPYLYLCVTGDTPISWRRIDGLGDLVHHFLRLDYGGFGQFAPGRDPVPAIDSLGALAAMLGRTWLWGPLLGGLAMLGVRAVVPAAEAAEPRPGWVLLAASFLLAGPLLVARFNVPPVGIGLVICHRFHLMSALLLTIPVAAALDVLGGWAAASVPSRLAAPWIGGSLAVLAFVALAARGLPLHSPAVERGAENLLTSLPPESVVIVTDDDLYYGTAYRQLLMHQRADVTVIAFGQLLNADYRARLHARTGVVMLAPGDKTPSVSLAEDTLARGRPMFADGAQINVLKSFPTYPYGIVFRVLPRGATSPPIEDVFAMNRALYDTFDFGYPMPDRDADYAAHMHERYAQTWRIIARALAAANQAPQAAIAADLALRLAP
jgi:hypothetical protein